LVNHCLQLILYQQDSLLTILIEFNRLNKTYT